MDSLIYTDIHNNIKKSTETIYEIKAPLASFDTIDLDDDGDEEQVEPQVPDPVLTPVAKQPEAFKDTVESDTPSPGGDSDDGSMRESDLPTPTGENPSNNLANIAAVATGATIDTPGEAERSNSAEHSSGSKDANSSENNASAEDITNKLKTKGRKYKAKASNVKYEQIENTSDVSDHEKSENFSPLPTLKLKSQHKPCDSDSDSTDSESGYIRSGFISAVKDPAGDRHSKPGHQMKVFNTPNEGKDFVDSDCTPHSSPQVKRNVLPPPLSKEDSAKRSKRKAYEKRLQRLQVTNTPVERPRSTTPINIYGLDEYVNISSPEKSPQSGNLEKLKIKLPLEESAKGKSPRKISRGATGGHDSNVFNFNEELLFTRTKPAILVQEDGSKGYSPKRILVPPTLSPKLSPATSRNPSILAQDVKHSPRYFYSPGTTSAMTDVASGEVETADVVNENWATFDEMPEKSEETNKDNAWYRPSDIEGKISEAVQVSEKCKESEGEKDEDIDILFDGSKLEDEILTVRIEETGDTKKCDIECQFSNSSDTNMSNRQQETEEIDLNKDLESENFSLC